MSQLRRASLFAKNSYHLFGLLHRVTGVEYPLVEAASHEFCCLGDVPCSPSR